MTENPGPHPLTKLFQVDAVNVLDQLVGLLGLAVHVLDLLLDVLLTFVA